MSQDANNTPGSQESDKPSTATSADQVPNPNVRPPEYQYVKEGYDSSDGLLERRTGNSRKK